MSAALEQTFHRLASRLVESVDDVVDAYFERLTAEEPYWGRQRPELFDTYRAISRASILAELECLRDGARPPDELPEADLEFARGAARIGAQPTDSARPTGAGTPVTGRPGSTWSRPNRWTPSTAVPCSPAARTSSSTTPPRSAG